MQFGQLKRREFLTLLGSAATTWPLVARAQQSAVPLVGYLGIGSLESNAPMLTGFRKGLGEVGFSEGRNLSIETRFASEPRGDRLLGLASDLVSRPVTVLVATGSARTAEAAKAATTTISIVFANGSDPVAVGLVASMNRPGGNATGVTFFTSALGPKRLELLRELLTRPTTIAFLVNPTNPVTEGDIKDIENAAASIGQRIFTVHASNENEIDAAFAVVARERAGALLVNVDAFFSSRRSSARRAGAALSDSRELQQQPIRHRRRADELRRQSTGFISTGRSVHRAYPKR
jgi:putative ABC transport system substrate-binding protein